jgi:hypothetical protein
MRIIACVLRVFRPRSRFDAVVIDDRVGPVFLGRHRTCDAQPFVLQQMPAGWNRRNIRFSKDARDLLRTCLSLADAKTGDLRIPGGAWFDSRFIQREAELSRDAFRNARNELIAANLLFDRRPHEKMWHRVKRRWYAVLGRSQYSIDIKLAKKPDFLLKPDFRSERESGPLLLIEAPKVKSGHKEPKKELKKDSSLLPTAELRQDHPNSEENSSSDPDLTNGNPEEKPSVEVKAKGRPDLTLCSMLGVRPEMFKDRSEELGMSEAESIWRSHGCPAERLPMIALLERIITELKDGVGYPPILLLRKKQLQRREYSLSLTAGIFWTPPPGACAKCGNSGLIQRANGSAIFCDCPAGEKTKFPRGDEKGESTCSTLSQ